MPDFSAKDVQALRQHTGAGMMDSKRALVENDGDSEAAAKWLREKGLAKAAGRSDRDNSEGCVAVERDGQVAGLVELKCETDFVAKSAHFTDLAGRIASAVMDDEGSAEKFSTEIDDLRVSLKEHIELGRVARIEASPGQVVGTYSHVQAGRGVNGVAVVIAGGSDELAYELCLHIAFAKPLFATRDEVPADQVAAAEEELTAISRNEGKPEAALPKIVAGRMDGWYAERCLLDQKFVRDEKSTVEAWLGASGATLVRFAQLTVG